MSVRDQVQQYRRQAREQRDIAAGTRYGGISAQALSSAEAFDRLAEKLEEALRYSETRPA